MLLCILYLIDKAATIKAIYDTKIKAINLSEWRPEGWLTFLMTGLPAGEYSLPTMVPRVDPNNLVLTQNKAVRKAARLATRTASGQTHKTKGLSAVVDLTGTKVKSIKHYHYIKAEANMDVTSHYKRKLDIITSTMSILERRGDMVKLQEYEDKQLAVSELMLKELEKLDPRTIITSSSSSSCSGNNTSSNVDDDTDDNVDDDGVDYDDDDV